MALAYAIPPGPAPEAGTAGRVPDSGRVPRVAVPPAIPAGIAPRRGASRPGGRPSGPPSPGFPQIPDGRDHGPVPARAGSPAGIRGTRDGPVAARPAQPLRIRHFRPGGAVTVTEVPDLVPARMLNEYAYCPRLFFLEWVDQSWAPSSDTAEGDRQHRRVDAGGGAVPLPDEGHLAAARSVDLASERLGITAKLDLLEGTDGGVIPVDTKKGRPARDGKPWPADAVQVCAQVLLLREHGYTVERGEIFYAETRQRVPVEMTPELVARTMEIVGEARATASRLAPPPPLRSSPKCPRCSLAGICLPDEVNVLASRQDGRTSRLMAADPDTVPLYVMEPGSMVG